ncbi:MAG: DUF2085 domain-containing protein [Anaerolineae bacterium]
MTETPKAPLSSSFWTWGGVLLAGAAIVVFVVLTPPSLLRKADYIGAAVCHRMPEHSFFIAEQQLPLCQRCTGTFNGALLGLLFQWFVLRRRRAQRFPALWIWGLMALFFMLWGLDGLNSFLASNHVQMDLAGVTLRALYEPQPWLRLLSGTLVGTSMSIALVAAFNQTMWADGLDEPSLRGWRDLSPLLAVELAQAGIIYLLEPWMLYPLALYSALGVLSMFVALGAMVWVMAVGLDQRYHRWSQLWLPLLWGLVFAAVIIGGMDALRLILTGTIDGVPTLPAATVGISTPWEPAHPGQLSP